MLLGTDLSPTQTPAPPPNLRFEIDDFTSTWTYPENSFDYIHMRYLFGCIPDQLALYKEAFKYCPPPRLNEQ